MFVSYGNDKFYNSLITIYYNVFNIRKRNFERKLKRGLNRFTKVNLDCITGIKKYYYN